MDEITIRAGETVPLSITIDDANALKAQLLVKLTQDAATTTIFKEANFIDGVADLTLSSVQTSVDAGEYVYQINVIYIDGSKEIYPDVSDCDGDCGFPSFTVCESLDIGVS